MNIVILDANTLTLDNDIDFSVFNQYGDVTIYQSSTDEEVGERIKDAEVVLCNKTVLNADKLSKAPNLKYIGLFATGYNNIDIDYTRAHSITVCNAGDYSTEAVAQHVFAFILHEYNTVDKYNTFVKNEGWVNAETFSPFFAMRELQGKTIGVIGYGSIGRKVADVARVFGMKVMAYDIYKNPDLNFVEYTDLDTVLEKSDLISLHCPLTDDSYHMINSETINKMKDKVVLVNTSRGALIDTEDLIKGIRQHKFHSVGLDVYEEETANVFENREDDIMETSITSRLLSFPNVIVTSHQAFLTEEALEAISYTTLENAQSYIEGHVIRQNLVLPQK